MCVYANTETTFIKFNDTFHIMNILTNRTWHVKGCRPLNILHTFQNVACFNAFIIQVRLFRLRLRHVTVVTMSFLLSIRAPFLLTTSEQMDQYFRSLA